MNGTQRLKQLHVAILAITVAWAGIFSAEAIKTGEFMYLLMGFGPIASYCIAAFLISGIRENQAIVSREPEDIR